MSDMTELLHYINHCQQCNALVPLSFKHEDSCSECGTGYCPRQRSFSLENPEIYSIKILYNRRLCLVIEAAEELIGGQIIKLFGDWVVTNEGIECLQRAYFIDMSIYHDSWIEHVKDQKGVVIKDFEAAVAFAKALIAKNKQPNK